MCIQKKIKNYLYRLKIFILFIKYFGRNFRPDTIRASKIYLNLMKILNYREYSLRKKYITRKIDFKKNIKNDLGYGIFSNNTFQNPKKILTALNSLKKDYNSINWNLIQKESKKSFLMSYSIKLDDRIKLIASEIVNVVTNYIGFYPVLLQCQFWNSPNKYTCKSRSQQWHIDGEDYKQLKVFIPIEDITNDSGPLNIIDASNSKIIFDDLIKKKIIHQRNTKINDSLINSYVSRNQIKKMTIKFGEFGFVDTCRCYHFGSRRDKKPRKLLFLHFTSAFSENLPSIFRKPNSFYKTVEDKLLYGYSYQNYKDLGRFG